MLNYIESTPPETIATMFGWATGNQLHTNTASTRVLMLISLTRFLLGIYPTEPIPTSMATDGRDMWAQVCELRRDHELHLLRGATYHGYRWVGEANSWAVGKWEQIQWSWFEQAVNKGWVANKAVLTVKQISRR